MSIIFDTLSIPTMNLPSVSLPREWKIRGRAFISFWHKLSLAQRLSLATLFLMIFAFPILLLASSQKTQLKSRAFTQPTTPPTPPSPTPTIPVTPPSPSPTSIYPTPTFIPTGTPTPTFSPTPTPTSTPKPTRTPTPKPTSTPTPKPNNPPVIITSFLPQGRLNRSYLASVTGYDRDTTDNLKMTITQLPPGLAQGKCTTSISSKRKNISCIISGKPKKVGNYNVRVSLTDNRGGSALKYLQLKVVP